MDIKKAIEKINIFIEVWDLEQADEEMKMIVDKEDIKSFKVAMQELEKRIAKTPKQIQQTDNKYKFGSCPSCGKTIDIYDEHCKRCGQKLDWD